MKNMNEHFGLLQHLLTTSMSRQWMSHRAASVKPNVLVEQRENHATRMRVLEKQLISLKWLNTTCKKKNLNFHCVPFFLARALENYGYIMKPIQCSKKHSFVILEILF